MGIFDMFTGDSAKRAANLNKDIYKNTAGDNSALYNNYRADSYGALDSGRDIAADHIKSGISSWDDVARGSSWDSLANLGTKYGGATSLLLDSYGVNGKDANARAANAFQTSPGYEFQMNQGLDALDRRAASRGMLGSGNTGMDTINYSQGQANKEYGNWRGGLAQFINPELSATSGAAAGRAAGVYGAAAGRASGYNSLANLYSGDAQSRVNVAGNYTSGMVGNNNMLASGYAGANNAIGQAEMQGSGNLWNFGLNAAKVGAGAYGGGAFDSFKGNPSSSEYGSNPFTPYGGTNYAYSR